MALKFNNQSLIFWQVLIIYFCILNEFLSNIQYYKNTRFGCTKHLLISPYIYIYVALFSRTKTPLSMHISMIFPRVSRLGFLSVKQTYFILLSFNLFDDKEIRLLSCSRLVSKRENNSDILPWWRWFSSPVLPSRVSNRCKRANDICRSIARYATTRSPFWINGPALRDNSLIVINGSWMTCRKLHARVFGFSQWNIGIGF